MVAIQKLHFKLVSYLIILSNSLNRDLWLQGQPSSDA